MSEDNILEFPSRASRAYAFLEEQLTAMLAAKGADTPLIHFATRTLRDVYGELAENAELGFSVRLPAATTADEAACLQEQIGDGIDKLRRQHHDMTLKLAARLLLTEMQLFQYQRQQPESTSDE